MRHPDGIAELEQQLCRHFHLPPPVQAPSTELFQHFIYLTQASCFEGPPPLALNFATTIMHETIVGTHVLCAAALCSLCTYLE